MEHLNVGLVAAVLTTMAFIPQAYKTIKTQETKNLSLITFLMIFLGTILWSVHGIMINDNPLIIANAITAFLSGIIVFLKLRGMVFLKMEK